MALTVVMSATSALQPWPMKILVDHALQHQPAPEWLAHVLRAVGVATDGPSLIVAAAAASVLVYAVSAILSLALTWAWAVAGQRMVYALSTDLFHRLQRLSLRYHSRNGVGDSLSRLSGDTWCVYTLTSQLVTPFEKMLTIVVMGGIAWQLHPGLTMLAFSTAPLIAGASFYFGKRLKRRAQAGRDAGTRLVSFLQQTLAAMPIVHAFRAEQRNLERFRDLSHSAIDAAEQGALTGSAFGLVTGLITTAGTAVVVFFGTTHALAGELSLGSLLLMIAYMQRIQSAAEALLKVYSAMKPVEASIERVIEVMDSDENDVREKRSAPPLPARGRGRRGRVVFENVTFGYEKDRPVLQQISLEARPGRKVALVGPTGAGKSTLVSMIPRFLDPDQGRVLFDGADVRDVQIASLREQVSIVLQEPFLFPLTVAENISYGRLNAARNDVVAAALAANADAFIRRLPDGYDTVLGERGATLSGGERQRIAIARALLKDAAVLILDEPTSAVDVETEASIMSALERLMEGRTTFVIAHRLSTIRNADEIIVLERGRMVESGAHAELLGRSGLYHRLHTLQYAAAGGGPNL
jgi:ATP-binding cassette subfamily B protein